MAEWLEPQSGWIFFDEIVFSKFSRYTGIKDLPWFGTSVRVQKIRFFYPEAERLKFFKWSHHFQVPFFKHWLVYVAISPRSAIHVHLLSHIIWLKTMKTQTWCHFQKWETKPIPKHIVFPKTTGTPQILEARWNRCPRTTPLGPEPGGATVDHESSNLTRCLVTRGPVQVSWTKIPWEFQWCEFHVRKIPSRKPTYPTLGKGWKRKLILNMCRLVGDMWSFPGGYRSKSSPPSLKSKMSCVVIQVFQHQKYLPGILSHSFQIS